MCEANEVYGEFKGYLRNLNYDYKCFIENSFIYTSQISLQTFER